MKTEKEERRCVCAKRNQINDGDGYFSAAEIESLGMQVRGVCVKAKAKAEEKKGVRRENYHLQAAGR